MASRDEITLPATRPKSRKSLAHVPSSVVDKENMTTDFAALASGKRGFPIEKSAKKSRSKSIGPGGLDALNDTSGNRRKSFAAVPHPPPKSILKPTMPPLREIPAHISSRRSPRKAAPPIASEENLIDFGLDPLPGTTVSGTDTLPNPFQAEGSAAVNETRVTLRTEEEQQAAAREREEKEREEMEKQVVSRRDARRKSLANRRVSFAPEATLHTWDVVVEYQDSTTSSNGTRRASTASGASIESPHPATPGPPSSDPSEPPSTPPEQIEEEAMNSSPEHQRDLHQKKRRRSSGIPPMNFNNPDEEFMSSSPFSGDSVGDADEAIDDVASNSNTDSEDDDGTTMMSLDGGETTDMSMASVQSASSTGSNTKLEAALREAARQAGTQGIDFDENGPLDPEEEEIVASFAPWSKKTPMSDLESREDQENVNPFASNAKLNRPQDEAQSDEEMTMDMTSAIGGILKNQEQPEDDEMSMDVTRAFGTIISSDTPQATTSRRKSVAPSRRQSTRRRSSGADSLGDGTMDLTMAVGGIEPIQNDATGSEDEDMTMDFTSVVGGVLPQSNNPKERKRSSIGNQKRQKKVTRESLDSNIDDETMEMTVAVGGIMPSKTEAGSDDNDETMGMEMTMAVGGTLQPQRSTGDRTRAKKVMELETDLASSPFQAKVLSQSPPKTHASVHTVASETGSPSFAAFRGKGLRRSTEARTSTTPKTRFSNGGTPVKKPATPSKQLTPQPQRPTTPGKTPPSKNVVMRTSSPKRLFKDDIKTSSTPQSTKSTKALTPNKLFQQDKATGISTPSFVLTPQRRRSSGLGLDKAGLGSPRVAAILDRRRSIGEQANAFVPSQPGDISRVTRFEDPRALENEVDDERAQEEARESGRKILEREADQAEEERDATLNLKEMIQSLTPKKKSLKGRKSLHVGAAKGLLGKRPAELDEDDDDDTSDSIKRHKGPQGSPVKNIRLQGPPSKEETTGRMTRAARKSLEQTNSSSITPTISSPPKSKATTPRHQGRFKDAEAGLLEQNIAPPTEKEPTEDPEVNEDGGEDPIQLQDFLNMTSIRFMELNTTKRRHTIAPRNSAKDFIDETPASLEDCVAAGAATLPMVDLFEHSCRELKSYITEGRKTVREIETETFEENPPLFREYISATPELKLFMDNQLKNVKTHARLLSKSTWYEWRMTLLTTLKEGLFREAEGMIRDEERLDEQQAIIDTVLPQLIQEVERLQQEETDYQLAAEELANCDPEELGNARQRLISVDADIEAKKQLISDLRRQLAAKESEINAGTEKKAAYLEEIQEAEKIREECRGWTTNEICVLKDKVNALEKQYGWTITGISGSTTSMTFRKEIELVFDASSFLSRSRSVRQPQNSRLDLWYIGASRELNPEPLTPEKEFFLQSIRDHIRGFTQAQTSVKELLNAVSSSWNKASSVVDNIRLLDISCPTEINKTSDSSILVQSSLLISPLTTKVEIAFHLAGHSTGDGLKVDITPSATVVYGERFNESKMGEFLLNRIGSAVEEKGQCTKATWGDAVTELGAKLLARGRK